jgi:hypothetical protein
MARHRPVWRCPSCHRRVPPGRSFCARRLAAGPRLPADPVRSIRPMTGAPANDPPRATAPRIAKER